MIQADRLHALADDLTAGYISTAQGVHSYLASHVDVLSLRTALSTGSAAFEDVKAFVAALLVNFHRGTRSPADIVLAAIVVAVEPLPGKPIDDFLESLAAVKIAELPLAPRVASITLSERRKRLAQLSVRELRIEQPYVHGCVIQVLSAEGGINYGTLVVRDMLRVA